MDKKRVVRSARAASQLVLFVSNETECQELLRCDVGTAPLGGSGRCGFLDACDLPGPGRSPARVADIRAPGPRATRLVTESIKCPRGG